MNISPQKLSVLLDIKKAEARLKIIYALEKKKGYVPAAAGSFDIKDEDNSGDVIDAKHTKDPVIDIKDMSEHMGIDLSLYVKDIRDSYFVRSQTRGWILNYPESKMKLNKKDEYPKSISIPAHIKCFLSKDTCDEIIAAWELKYAHWIKKFNVKFK